MRRIYSIIKLIGFIKFLLPKKRRKRKIKILPLLNPKRGGKIAYHAARIKFRNEINRYLY